jgi:hypothetical protein
LSILMPDWFNPESKIDKKYGLVKKFSHPGTDLELDFEVFKRFFDEKGSHRHYKDVVLRMIYQYFYELELEGQKLNEDSIENLIEKALDLKDAAFRNKILQILIVFFQCDGKKPEDISEEDWFKKRSEQIEKFKKIENLILTSGRKVLEKQETFFRLAFLLKKNQDVSFKYEFEKYITKMEQKYGDYIGTALKPDVRLLLKIAKNAEMFYAQSVIFEKFPFAELNFSIMRSFRDVQDLKMFRVNSFESEEVKRLFKEYEKALEIEGKENYKIDFYNFLCKLYQMLKELSSPEDSGYMNKWKRKWNKLSGRSNRQAVILKKDLKMLLFDRNMKSPYETIFERILSIKPLKDKLNQDLVTSVVSEIWMFFELASREELLTMVKGFFLMSFSWCKISFTFRKTSMKNR